MMRLLTKLRYLWVGFKHRNRPHLTATVTYNGERCVLTQGVKNPKWNMVGKESGTYYTNVPISDCVLDTSLKAKWKAIKFHYDFEMTYWFPMQYYR